MKFCSVPVLLAALLPSTATAAVRGAQANRSLQSWSCKDIPDWVDDNGNNCAYYEARNGEGGNLNGASGLTANTACCAGGGGLEEDAITVGFGWQLFRHDSWIWDIHAVELYSSADCSEISRIDVADATYPDSGHHPQWPPERPFRSNPDAWGGRWDETGGSLYLGIEFPYPVDVQCIRIKQREDGPILIRAKEDPNGAWKNVKYIPYVAGDEAGYQTIQIGELPPPPTCTDIPNWIGRNWRDENGNDCAYYEEQSCAGASMNGNFGLTANTACCSCNGGMEENDITVGFGWQLFRHDDQQDHIWDIHAVELYSSADCNDATRIDVTGATYSDSGHYDDPSHHPYWRPERPFSDRPSTWGGRTDGESFYLGIEFPAPQVVQCIRVKQHEDGPILIRAKETPNGEWKNVKYISYVAGEEAGFQTIQIGEPNVVTFNNRF